MLNGDGDGCLASAAATSPLAFSRRVCKCIAYQPQEDESLHVMNDAHRRFFHVVSGRARVSSGRTVRYMHRPPQESVRFFCFFSDLFPLFRSCAHPLPLPLPSCAPLRSSCLASPPLPSLDLSVQVRRAMAYFVQSGKPLWGFTESSVDLTLLCLMGGCTKVGGQA